MAGTTNQGMGEVADWFRDLPWDNIFSYGVQTVTLLIAIYACILARQQLLPLRKDIAKLAAAERRGERLRTELLAPAAEVQVLGFDARFTNGDWYNILSNPVAPPTIKLNLGRSYKMFYDALEAGRAPIESRCILIIGFVYCTEYLHRGWIDPIPQDGALEFEKLMAFRAEAHGHRHDEATGKLARYLCSDPDGTVGALPIWLNSHGRMIPEPQLFEENGRLAGVASLDDLFQRSDAQKVLAEASVQGYHLMFEFWAHLAYRGCRLFRSVPNEPRAIRSDVLASPDELEKFAEAVADLGTRLRFSNRTRKAFQDAEDRLNVREEHRFAIGHNADARMIREGLALWKPVFSSELLWKASRRRTDPASRLTDETDFRPPYYRHTSNEDWSYLSTVGGYGLALPKGASKDPECVKALKYMFLANPCLVHPYLPEMLGYEANDEDVRVFAERHARPRWPFWQGVKVQISNLLMDLLLSVDRTSPLTPAEFRTNCVTKVMASRERIEELFELIRQIGAEQQPEWTFRF
jgi:hypothetical protein